MFGEPKYICKDILFFFFTSTAEIGGDGEATLGDEM
jgi:hypothetical protein